MKLRVAQFEFESYRVRFMGRAVTVEQKLDERWELVWTFSNEWCSKGTEDLQDVRKRDWKPRMADAESLVGLAKKRQEFSGGD